MVDYERRTVLQGIGAIGAASVVGVGAASADDDDGDGEAKVRVAHASPDAPNVDVFVGDAKVLADVPFTAVSGYLELESGTYEVTIAAASDAESPDEAETVAFQGDVSVEAEDYTIAAIGELTPDVSDEGFRPAIFEDKLGVLDDGTGRVRVVHASPNAPAVDVRVVDDNGDTVLTLADGIAFGEASANVEAPSGTYSVAVYPAGGDEAVFGPVGVDVRDGEVLTVFAEGFLGDEPAFQPVLAYEEAAPFGESEGDDEEEEEDEADDYGDEEEEEDEYEGEEEEDDDYDDEEDEEEDEEEEYDNDDEEEYEDEEEEEDD